MSAQNFDRSKYDVVSLSRKDSDKKTNFVQDAYQMNKAQRTSGQFVRVFADIFLKHEAKKSFC